MCADPRATGTVVVGCDSSWASQNAVAAATREASLRGSKLVLLSVVEGRPHWPDGLAWAARIDAESAQEARVVADLAMAKVVATDGAVAARTAIVVVNDVDSPELAELAELAGRAGLLVLGRRGDGGQTVFSMGSTSGELARRFDCPMLVVHDRVGPRGTKPPGPDCAVIVGMDLLGPVGGVLPVAMAEAVIRDVPLVVVHTVRHGMTVDQAAIDAGWDRCRAELAEAHPAADPPVRLVIARGDPARELLERAGPTDLIVVGTRGQGRLAGLVTASVSRDVLDSMVGDVLVVQPDRVAGGSVPSELSGLAGRV